MSGDTPNGPVATEWIEADAYVMTQGPNGKPPEGATVIILDMGETLKVGERVTHNHRRGEGIVLAIHGEHVWVKWPDWSDPDTCLATSLTATNTTTCA